LFVRVCCFYIGCFEELFEIKEQSVETGKIVAHLAENVGIIPETILQRRLGSLIRPNICGPDSQSAEFIIPFMYGDLV
jgi:hypothetical protein